MTATTKLRATVMLEWTGDGHQGMLVHADRYKNTWILPGGGIEVYKKSGKLELPMAAAIRELFEETGLTAEEVKFLCTHEGGHYQHHVFAVRATGTLDYLSAHQNLQLVRFVLWKENLEIYSQALKKLLSA
jgi:8-oxo-dGTP pyrophosphatase MutT (NUDIX family)